MEVDACAADSGLASHAVDRRAAGLVAFDGDARTDGQIADVQVKRAAVLSVKRRESQRQR